MQERVLPHDIETEEATLGSLLIGGDFKDTRGIKGTDFYSERNRWIFEACASLIEKKVGIDQITVGHELGDKIAAIGGSSFLLFLTTRTPTSLDLPYYSEIVKKLSLKRQLIEYSEKVAELGYNASGDIREDFSRADSLFLNLRKKNVPLQIVTPADRVRLLNDRYEKINIADGGIAIPTGLNDLDEWLGGGFMGGDFVVIGARTGVGKTTILQSIANKIGKESNVLYVSVEMTTESLTDRDVAGYLGEPVANIRRGDFEASRTGLYGDILQALEYHISKLKVYYASGPFGTEDVRQLALSMQVRYGLSAIMVDYLGILKDKYGNNDEQRLSYISRTLKQIAMEFNVPLIAPHQLNRSLESREDKKPQLYDLRGSGSIENDADVVLLMYRENYYKRITDTTTEVIIAKQRQGSNNKVVKISFDEKHQRYCDLIHADTQEGLLL
jgi:replicative DNA helicase